MEDKKTTVQETEPNEFVNAVNNKIDDIKSRNSTSHTIIYFIGLITVIRAVFQFLHSI